MKLVYRRITNDDNENKEQGQYYTDDNESKEANLLLMIMRAKTPISN